MKKARTKTDNSHLDGKVKLRILLLPPKKRIKVLDAFGGKGVIWNTIRQMTLKDIIVIPLEKEKNKNKKAIQGDNLKIIPSIDISEFDVIDLDAYGSPYKQIEAVVNNPTFSECVMFTTDIQTMQGRAPDKLLEKAGITKRMLDKTPTLFNIFTDQAMHNYMHEIGVEKYFEYRPEKNKKYRGFKLKRSIKKL